MNKEIEDIIINEFKKLKNHYEFEVEDKNRFIKHLEESLIDDERETNINDKYTEEDIENIRDVIKDCKSMATSIKTELYNCKKVLKFFDGYTPNYYFKTNKH